MNPWRFNMTDNTPPTQDSQVKRCVGKCQRILPRSSFGIDNHVKDGRRGRCKRCRSPFSLEEFEILQEFYQYVADLFSMKWKLCISCIMAKPAHDFYNAKRLPLG